MRVTIAICTWNRAALLDQTLTALHRLEIPSGTQWDVLVVNNACTDDTDSVLARHAQHLPLRRLHEATPGKSHALNAAIAAIDSDLILWTDDDVLVDQQWLAEYVRAAAARPDVAFFGGTILPWFESEPPAWIRENWSLVANVYGAREFSQCSAPIDGHELPYGANFAIRTSVQQRFPYNPRLGKVRTGTLRGEETELFLRLLADGHRGQWCGTARLSHFIPKAQQTERYIRQYLYGIGQTQAATFAASINGRPASARPFALRMRAIKDEIKYRLRRRLSRSERWLKCLMQASLAWGQLAGLPAETAPKGESKASCEKHPQVTMRREVARHLPSSH